MIWEGPGGILTLIESYFSFYYCSQVVVEKVSDLFLHVSLQLVELQTPERRMRVSRRLAGLKALLSCCRWFAWSLLQPLMTGARRSSSGVYRAASNRNRNSRWCAELRSSNSRWLTLWSVTSHKLSTVCIGFIHLRLCLKVQLWVSNMIICWYFHGEWHHHTFLSIFSAFRRLSKSMDYKKLI